ncbi:MAG: DUF47 domain-containing protein [Salinivirgaceae bacterium]|jgi:predicted phosphate transport protein (TIGR00153 family)
MALLFKNTSKTISKIDEFINKVEDCLMLYREAIKNYLDNKPEQMADRLRMLEREENKADRLQRSVENYFLKHSLLPQHAADILMLLDHLDDMVDLAKYGLQQIEIELPEIPETYRIDYLKLTEISLEAAQEAIMGTRAFFLHPQMAKNHAHKIYFFEKETDQVANLLRKRIFQEPNGLHLSHKSQLRYFTRHIEQISDSAEDVADALALLTVKISL